MRLLAITVLLLLTCTFGCTVTQVILPEEMKQIWDPDSTIYEADLAVDTPEGRFGFKAGNVVMDSTEIGRELRGYEQGGEGREQWVRGRKPAEVTDAEFRISFEEVQRMWYYEDIVVHSKDGGTFRVDSGEWFMSVQEGRVISLVTTHAKAENQRGQTQGLEKELQAGDIRAIEVRSVDTLGPGMLILGGVGIVALATYVLFSSSSWFMSSGSGSSW